MSRPGLNATLNWTPRSPALGPTHCTMSAHVPHLFSLWQSRPKSAEPSFESVSPSLPSLPSRRQCKIKRRKQRHRYLGEEIATRPACRSRPTRSPHSFCLTTGMIKKDNTAQKRERERAANKDPETDAADRGGTGTSALESGAFDK